MKEAQFEALWQQHLKPHLAALEIERKKALRQVLGYMLLLGAPIFTSFVPLVFPSLKFYPWMLASMLPIMILLHH